MPVPELAQPGVAVPQDTMATGATDARVDKLISLLVRNATVVVPRPQIVEEIGVTRSTVWEWIEKLRSLVPPVPRLREGAVTVFCKTQ